ncbi:g4457 [Coccomyxa viridis]|uniref:G4457 protein n=1 Tax=Coccomyxa viridis TaxID=1274662 RepID=A0ABP1FQD2_9CHLO
MVNTSLFDELDHQVVRLKLTGRPHSVCRRAGGGHHCAARAGGRGCAESGWGCCASLSKQLVILLSRVDAP